ncbi:uncharacterized protein DS421_18g621360 [Arachis hypogaea]|nr:uncharacterized protein DS421_18g621360 [Arachis hypogaea]
MPLGCQVGWCVGSALGLSSAGPIAMQGRIGLEGENCACRVSGEKAGREIGTEVAMGQSWDRVTRDRGPVPLSGTGGSGDPTRSQPSRVWIATAPLDGGRVWPGYPEERAADLGGVGTSAGRSVVVETRDVEEVVVGVEPCAGEDVQRVMVSGSQWGMSARGPGQGKDQEAQEGEPPGLIDDRQRDTGSMIPQTGDVGTVDEHGNPEDDTQDVDAGVDPGRVGFGKKTATCEQAAGDECKGTREEQVQENKATWALAVESGAVLYDEDVDIMGILQAQNEEIAPKRRLAKQKEKARRSRPKNKNKVSKNLFK